MSNDVGGDGMEDFVGSLIGGEIMEIATILTDAKTVVTTSATTITELVATVPMLLLPAAFVFGRKLLGMAKSIVFAGGRRRR